MAARARNLDASSTVSWVRDPGLDILTNGARNPVPTVPTTNGAGILPGNRSMTPNGAGIPPGNRSTTPNPGALVRQSRVPTQPLMGAVSRGLSNPGALAHLMTHAPNPAPTQAASRAPIQPLVGTVPPVPQGPPNPGALAQSMTRAPNPALSRPSVRRLHDLLRAVSVVTMQGPRERRWRWKI